MLLHLDMAAKHDAELGQAWLRQLRGDAPHVSAFACAACFTLAGIQRFEQPVIGRLGWAGLAGLGWADQAPVGSA